MNIPAHINYPKSISEIKTGRSTIEKWMSVNYPEFLTWLRNEYDTAHSVKEMLYMFFQDIPVRPKCVSCGKDVKYHGYEKGFGTYCCPKCAQTDSDVRARYVASMITKYGEDYTKKCSEKGMETKLKRYGNKNYNNHEKMKTTCMERYGVDNVMKSSEFVEKSRETCMERYGVPNFVQSDSYKSSFPKILTRMRNTCMERYGVPSPMQSDEIKKKVNETCMERYGCMWNCMREESHNSHNVNSGPNKYIKDLSEHYGIEYTIEHSIERFVFDFKVGDTLIEVNPYATHNVNWSPYGDVRIDKNYHMSKTNAGKMSGYRVINIWDWDDADMIIKSLVNKQPIYARNCEVRSVSIEQTREFLNEYHFQGFCKNQKIVYGLFHNGELVQLMSFGKPRYNKHYEYELLRLCTRFDVYVIGGTQKLFSHFIKEHNPISIISYCDESKFTGDVYQKLGFSCLKKPQPSRHWYKEKGCIHITDNLLRQKGYDKLFGTNFGKGTSNDVLMLNDDFVEIYDAGQSTWVMKLKK